MFTDINTLNKRTEINKMASNKQKEAARIIKFVLFSASAGIIERALSPC